MTRRSYKGEPATSEASIEAVPREISSSRTISSSLSVSGTDIGCEEVADIDLRTSQVCDLVNKYKANKMHEGPPAVLLGPAFCSADMDTSRGTECGPYLRRLRVAGRRAARQRFHRGPQS